MTHGPLPRPMAFRAVAASVLTTITLLRHRQVHQPPALVGRRLRSADGSEGRVYRETVLDHAPVADACILVVAFRLRRVRGRGHLVFRIESLLNTPLFVGFPGFVSKLWLAHDQHETYRGVYEWDGPERAEHYARCLWQVLALVSEAGSIDYRVLPGMHREELLHRPDAWTEDTATTGAGAWWRLVDVG
jgi:hypothetical protein